MQQLPTLAGHVSALSHNDISYKKNYLSLNNNGVPTQRQLPTLAGHVSALSHIDSNSKKSRLSGNNNGVPTERQLPTLAGHVSTLRTELRDITTLQPLNPTTLLSWHSVGRGGRREQLNHVVIAEKRRLALQKERLRAQKLRSVAFDKSCCKVAMKYVILQ